ncbi:hypothetical protein [Mycobacterium sp. 1274761.0]|uniref:hypothetical protein n=1 Tax=Mycobacterium sp. 1274761.0 TaxID=1834077 RepID=UPI0008016FB6|nr:hypothetical protein [Mycobacterium sp. 1274761.0]OBK76304.1 hypothetical protein A5651_06780 [Mycobacterium sp. 1274761.0]
MTLPADWIAGDDFTAADEINVETALNNLANGSTVIPRYVNISGASTLTLTVAKNMWVFNGTTAAAWTLPAVSGNTGYTLWLYNRGTANLTVQRAGSDQIYHSGGAVTSMTLLPGQSVELLNDGTYWLVFTGGAAQPPSVDNSAKSTEQSGVVSPATFTWNHTVGASASRVIVIVYGSSGMTASATATVTFGGTALTELGSSVNTSAGHWQRWFIGTPPGSGSKTASVTLTQSGGATLNSGGAMSITCNNVTTAAGFTTSSTDGSGATLTVTPSNVPNLVVFSSYTTFGGLSVPIGTRQTLNGKVVSDVVLAQSNSFPIQWEAGSPSCAAALNLY